MLKNHNLVLRGFTSSSTACARPLAEFIGLGVGEDWQPRPCFPARKWMALALCALFVFKPREIKYELRSPWSATCRNEGGLCDQVLLSSWRWSMGNIEKSAAPQALAQARHSQPKIPLTPFPPTSPPLYPNKPDLQPAPRRPQSSGPYPRSCGALVHPASRRQRRLSRQDRAPLRRWRNAAMAHLGRRRLLAPGPRQADVTVFRGCEQEQTLHDAWPQIPSSERGSDADDSRGRCGDQ